MINGSTVGVFTTAIESTDDYYGQSHGLALDFYLSHSAEKYVSATYEIIKAQLEAQPTIQKTVNELLGEMCRNKFQQKWTKIYQALLLGNYDPLEDYTHFEHKTATNTDTTTYGKSTTRNDEYNSSVEDNGKKGTNQTVTTTYSDEHTKTVEDTDKTVNNETVTSDNTNEDNTYGFNSATPVGADNSSSAGTETTAGTTDTTKKQDTTDNTSSTNTESTVGTADTNTTYNKQDHTGNDTRTETDSGSDKTDYDVDETIDQHGRNVGAQELLQKELDLRAQNIFYNIVLQDVDSVVSSRIY